MDPPSRDEALRRAQALLDRCAKGFAGEPERREAALALALEITRAGRADEGLADRLRRELLARLCADERGQAFLSAVADRMHRASTRRAAATLRDLLITLGTPTFLPAALRAPLALVARGVVPSALSVRGFERGVRAGSRGLVHDATPRAIDALVRARAREHTAVNVNLVGELVLGEREAARRALAYRSTIARGGSSAVSVKLSSIASQISLSAHAESLDLLAPRLLVLYRAAQAQTPHVLVNLDMEAFDDLDLTLALHARLAQEPSIADLVTGVVLQAYLPDAHARYDELLALARARVARGFAPLRVRIVKGANLAMERHQAALRGHPLPIYGSKAETDASWLRLVERALHPDHARVLHVGVASHNVFDLSFALALRAEQRVDAFVDVEMLEGMADPQRRTVATLAGSMLVYAPITEPESFDAAIAYLVRRLDEATAPGHFLRESFAMTPLDARYRELEGAHQRALALRGELRTASLRARPRAAERSLLDAAFRNEPDTDWALALERDPMLAALEQRRALAPDDVMSIVEGRPREGRVSAGFDPSRPGHTPYHAHFADRRVVDDALDAAKRSRFSDVPARERAERLLDVAQAMRLARRELVAAIVLDGGRRMVEADVEVSEAIDFAEYYARAAVTLAADPCVKAHPRGTVLVAAPWNFPLAIGVGGALAALAAGNEVLLKPSPKTPMVAREFTRLAHSAGIPPDALALLVIDDDVARDAVLDPRVDALVLTGSTRTARAIRAARPSLPLFAETGGKNAMIVSALADRDLAIRDALSSAFGHAGQKCSATSLLVCEREVYEDASFRERLLDATESLPVGSAWDPASVVVPLIEPPRGALERALTTLESGESWLLPPRRSDDNPRLMAPSIKLGTRAGSFTHQTELFGPVLALMCADDLDHALRLANGTPYGLTGGLQSLDPREQSHYLRHIRVGNAYVNRGTTGAIVQRQPFGGIKSSCFGPGAKAGGPGYVRQLSRLSAAQPPASELPASAPVLALLERARPYLEPQDRIALSTLAARDRAIFEDSFASPRDPTGLATQRNLLAYVPREEVLLLVTLADSASAILRALIAAATVGVQPALGLVGAEGHAVVHALASHVTLFPPDADGLAERLAHVPETTCVTLSLPSAQLYEAAARADKRLLQLPLTLPHHDALAVFLEERSLTIEDHRYGQPLPLALRAPYP